jgi:hypothetical protein
MADTPLWTDIAGFGVALIGATTGIIALFKTGKTNDIAEGANRIAGESKDEAAKANTHSVEANRIAGEALRSARDSATSARESAEAAEATARIDRASRHDDRRPAHPGKIDGFLKGTTTPGSKCLRPNHVQARLPRRCGRAVRGRRLHQPVRPRTRPGWGAEGVPHRDPARCGWSDEHPDGAVPVLAACRDRGR